MKGVAISLSLLFACVFAVLVDWSERARAFDREQAYFSFELACPTESNGTCDSPVPLTEAQLAANRLQSTLEVALGAEIQRHDAIMRRILHTQGSRYRGMSRAIYDEMTVHCMLSSFFLNLVVPSETWCREFVAVHFHGGYFGQFTTFV
jgi:hypothetical protein